MSETSSLPPGLIIGAPRSGSGKTTVTLGLLRALKRRGHAVQPFKCGPDYIDPAFHVAAAGRESYNVDSWAMRWPRVAGLLSQASNGADIVIVEGLMGFYDGVVQPGHWGNGASSDLAAATGWPAILVLDVSGQSQTAAAVARGFMNFRDRVEIAGVILNRVGSARHTRFVSEALTAVGLPVVGALPREANLVLPERHLGLVQAEETAELESRLETLADFIDANVDMERIVQLAKPGSVDSGPAVSIRPPGQRIALIGVGFSILCVGLLSMIAGHATLLQVEILTTLIGLGMGTTFPVSTIAVQNAVDQTHLGVATGVLTFLRSLGSALGVAMLGAVALGYGMPLAAEGGVGHIEVSSALPFVMIFIAAGITLILSLAMLSLMPEKPLRGRQEHAAPVLGD